MANAGSTAGASAQTFKEFISIRKISEDVFETLYNPERMGNQLPIAYGGCAIAAALNAAYHTLRAESGDPYKPIGTGASMHLYSATGYYLGPAAIDRKLICGVRRMRDTRSFATRLVEVYQDFSEGNGTNGKDAAKGRRTVLVTTMDFHAAERGSILEYSAPPTRRYGGVDKQTPVEELYAKYLRDGKVTQQEYDAGRTGFRLFSRFFEQRPCIEGIFAQNILGAAKNVQTTQDDGRPITEKTSADWFRTVQTPADESEQLCSALFAMDGAIAFMPLSHSHMFLDDAAAVSSLDFAFRVFSNNVDMGRWHLREMTTTAAAVGRSYSEARMWDGDGNMIASMTQQSILRPHKSDAKI